MMIWPVVSIIGKTINKSEGTHAGTVSFYLQTLHHGFIQGSGKHKVLHR